MTTPRFLALLLALLGNVLSHAATIETVPIGNAGNPADATGFGAVSYGYRIGKYEVTNSQYVEFLNSVDPTGVNTLGLYNPSMDYDPLGSPGYVLVNPAAADGSKYFIVSGGDNYPVVFVSWYDALRFANWLHNGQGSGDTEDGAYTLLGGTPTPSNADSITRNPGAKWWLPNADEWYKAAYYNPAGADYFAYPTASSIAPTGEPPPGTSNSANYDSAVFAITAVGAYISSDSPYGTFDEGGNVFEWNETPFRDSFRFIRGGAWASNSRALHVTGDFIDIPTGERQDTGFRVASAVVSTLSGDYNADGVVNAADYVVWRMDDLTQEGYDAWRAHFGNTAAIGSAVAFHATVPEADSALLILAASAGAAIGCRRRMNITRPKASRTTATGRSLDLRYTAGGSVGDRPQPCWWHRSR